MIDGIVTVIKFVIIGILLGGVFGILIAALTGEYLLWIGLSIVLGAGFGTALAYGFLPES
jgi:hypothetical protein